MSTWRTITERKRRAQRGSAALSAIFTLIIGLLIALALVRISDAVFLSGHRQVLQQGAQVTAEAGLEYGYWQYAFQNQALPYNGTRSLGGGTITVAVTDNSATLAGTVKVVSTGTQSGRSETLTRVYPVARSIFAYTLAANSSVSTSRTVVTGASNANGDVHVNGSLTSWGFGSRYNGDISATGTVTAFGTVTGDRTSNAQPVAFPAIDLNALRTIAQNPSTGMYIGYSYSIGSVPLPSTGFVGYVNGNLTLTGGTISGTGTIVVTGTLYIRGNYSYSLSSDKVAFLVQGGIDATQGGSVVGLYYAHNSGNTATATLGNSGTPASFTITRGRLIADRITFNYNASVLGDAGLTPAAYKALRLPGY